MKGLDLNELVKIKLTTRGKEILKDAYKNTFYNNGSRDVNLAMLVKEAMETVDKDDCVEMFLWQVMETFGGHMQEQPFYGTILINEEKLKDVESNLNR